MADEEDTRNKVELGTGDEATDDQVADDQVADDKGSDQRALSVVKLTANRTGMGAPNIARSLTDPRGIARFNGMLWIPGARSGDVVILDGDGVPSTGDMPGVPRSGEIHLERGISGVAVTGAEADDPDFPIHSETACNPAQLLFSSETGRIFGVNTEVDTKDGFEAAVVIDRSKVGANFKGITVIHGTRGSLILAADFRNARIDVFDEEFRLVKNVRFEVGLPAGFAPHNVASLGDRVIVTFAKQDAKKENAVTGPGLGFVAMFDLEGRLLGLAKGPELNAPFGVELACNFAQFPNALLVSNTGSGRITVIDLRTMEVRGQLTDRAGKTVVIEDLWGIRFGTGVEEARSNELFFTARPNEGKDGLFGKVARTSGKDK
jgi:uncharacterized protein (TIGR03118 family)